MKTGMQRLDDWLANNKAKNIRHQKLDNGDILDFLVVNGRIMILHTYADENGWEIYVPATDSNEVDSTFCALGEWAENSATPRRAYQRR